METLSFAKHMRPQTVEQPEVKLRSTGYVGFVWTACQHELTMLLRAKRTILGAVACLAPVVMVLAVPYLSAAPFRQSGTHIFVMMVDYLFLGAMAPVVALYFGSVLIAEDVDSETLPYLLVRPVPRSALVAGRLLAYLLVASVVLITSLVLTFGACSAVGDLALIRENFVLVAHYGAVLVLAALSYGALAMFLGAWLKRPVVVGVVFLFGWQRAANIVPGAVDFLTIEKYLRALMPALATERAKTVIKTALGDFEKEQLIVQVPSALAILAMIVLAFSIATVFMLHHREYSRARAAGG